MKKQIYRPRRGFTLAEVLVVLGVIGIVAALTIPTLLKNWQAERWDTASKVFENRLIEAVSQMHARARLEGQGTTENFVDGLNIFMKVTKTCQNTELDQCFGPTIGGAAFNADSFKKASAFGHNWGTNVMGVKLTNGASMLIAYNPACNLDPAASGVEVANACIAAVYDTNGSSEPNEASKDIGYFNNSTARTSCEEWQGAALINGKCWLADNAISEAYMSRFGSYAPYTLDTYNGSAEDKAWDPKCRMPSSCESGQDLPECGMYHTFCRYNHWAASKKLCSEIGMRLPTTAELRQEYIYCKNLDGGDPNSGFCMSSLYGAPWSSEEYEGEECFDYVGICAYLFGQNGAEGEIMPRSKNNASESLFCVAP